MNKSSAMHWTWLVLKWDYEDGSSLSPSRTFEVCQNQPLSQERTADKKVECFRKKKLKRIPSQHKAWILSPLDPVNLQLLWERRFCRAPENFTLFYPTQSINIGQTKPWIYMKACFILVLFLHSYPLVRTQPTINSLCVKRNILKGSQTFSASYPYLIFYFNNCHRGSRFITLFGRE